MTARLPGPILANLLLVIRGLRNLAATLALARVLAGAASVAGGAAALALAGVLTLAGVLVDLGRLRCFRLLGVIREQLRSRGETGRDRPHCQRKFSAIHQPPPSWPTWPSLSNAFDQRNLRPLLVTFST